MAEVVPLVASVVLWKWLLNADYGLVNQGLRELQTVLCICRVWQTVSDIFQLFAQGRLLLEVMAQVHFHGGFNGHGFLSTMFLILRHRCAPN